MGGYLSQPITDKHSDAGVSGRYQWAASEMQGWRTNMEDAHIAGPILSAEQGEAAEEGAPSLFAVFDGHGGQEVAKFCAAHLPELLKSRLHDVGPSGAGTTAAAAAAADALKQSFHKLDDLLRLPAAEDELRLLRNGTSDASDDGGPTGGFSTGSTGSSTTSAGAPSPKRKAADLLQASIQEDLSSAKKRGSLSRDDAQRVMVKMMLLKKLEAQAERAGAALEDTSGATTTTTTGGEDGDTGDDREVSDEFKSLVEDTRGETTQPPLPTTTTTTTAADNVGCTAVSALVFPAPHNRVVVANAGDSRCVMSRAGRALNLSEDHKPNDDTEKRRIEAAGGYVEEISTHNGARMQYRVNGNLNLSRSLGDLNYKRRTDLGPEQQVISGSPDVMEQPLTAEDEFLVLACDGVWDIMSSQECVDFVRERLVASSTASHTNAGGDDEKPTSSSLVEIAEQVFDHCITEDPKLTQGLGADNMTCVIVLLKPVEQFE